MILLCERDAAIKIDPIRCRVAWHRENRNRLKIYPVVRSPQKYHSALSQRSLPSYLAWLCVCVCERVRYYYIRDKRVETEASPIRITKIK